MNAFLHAELKRIDDLINDVEMQVCDVGTLCLLLIAEVPLQGPLSEELTFIVIDTNIVLHHLEVIDHFIKDIETLSLPVMIIVPGVVVNELDGYVYPNLLASAWTHTTPSRQKNRNGLAWFARRASAWLLLRVKERKSVKGQALNETCKASKNWKSKEVRALRKKRFLCASLT